MPWMGPAITAAGGLASSALGFLGASETNKAAREMSDEAFERSSTFSAEQAYRQMQFQERMSRNRYQYTVDDMQRAGLNPMLAYQQGGGSPPSGAQGAATMQPAPVLNRMAAGGASAAQFVEGAARLAGIEFTKAQTDVAKAEKFRVDETTRREASSAGHLKAMEEQIRQEMKTFEDRWERLRIDKEIAALGLTKEQAIQKIANGQLELRGLKYPDLMVLLEQAKKLKSEAELARLQIPQGLAEAAFYSSEVGKHWPFVEKGIEAGARGVGGIFRGLRR